ncbi:hypothetical protein DFJ73DRAFT_820327 [Zopfochytrium polystomum]|nr:hypothetical protein DFJ73DRAFT_820327 [Zopfochytrium polystomum]
MATWFMNATRQGKQNPPTVWTPSTGRPSIIRTLSNKRSRLLLARLKSRSHAPIALPLFPTAHSSHKHHTASLAASRPEIQGHSSINRFPTLLVSALPDTKTQQASVGFASRWGSTRALSSLFFFFVSPQNPTAHQDQVATAPGRHPPDTSSTTAALRRGVEARNWTEAPPGGPQGSTELPRSARRSPESQERARLARNLASDYLPDGGGANRTRRTFVFPCGHGCELVGSTRVNPCRKCGRREEHLTSDRLLGVSGAKQDCCQCEWSTGRRKPRSGLKKGSPSSTPSLLSTSRPFALLVLQRLHLLNHSFHWAAARRANRTRPPFAFPLWPRFRGVRQDWSAWGGQLVGSTRLNPGRKRGRLEGHLTSDCLLDISGAKQDVLSVRLVDGRRKPCWRLSRSLLGRPV